MSVKKLIEKKQERLNRLVHHGQISQADANKQILSLAKCYVPGPYEEKK